MPFSSMCGSPYLMAVFAAVAIGVAVYEIVTSRERVSSRQSNNRSRPPGSSDPPWGSDPPTSRKPKDPRTSLTHPKDSLSSRKSSPQDPLTSSKLTQDSPTSPSKPKDPLTSHENPKDPFTSSSEPRKYQNSRNGNRDSESRFIENRVRKRNVTALKPDMSKTNKRLHETPSNMHKEFLDADNSGSESKKISSNTYHKDVYEKNYEKAVYGNILNDTKEINVVTKSAQNNVNSNIYDEDSDSENNIYDKTDNVKMCNIDVSDQTLYSSGGSNNLSQSSTEEEIYKKKVLDALKNENIKCQEAAKGENDVHHHPVKKDENLDDERMKDKNVKENQEASGILSIDLNMKKGICSGCEEAPINAVAYPCGHCYLCSGCAKVVFRIHKICSVCLTEIAKFE